MSGSVRWEADGPVGWVIFDNPERRNALTAAMMTQVLDALEEAAKDKTIRVVALRGAGELAFVSGADVKAFGSSSGVESGPPPEQVMAAIADLPKPVVAALRGWCLGAGILLALSADLRIAGDDLKIGIPAAKLGVASPRGGVDKLVSVVGPAVASELLMTGGAFDATEALRTGLVNRVVPANLTFAEVQRRGEAIAANAPLTHLASKRTIASVLDPSDAAAGRAAEAAIADCYTSEDFREGLRAFSEKRKPKFEGR